MRFITPREKDFVFTPQTVNLAGSWHAENGPLSSLPDVTAGKRLWGARKRVNGARKRVNTANVWRSRQAHVWRSWQANVWRSRQANV